MSRSKVETERKVVKSFKSHVTTMKHKNMLVGEGFTIQERKLNGKTVMAFNVARMKAVESLTVATETVAKCVQRILDDFSTQPQCQEMWESWGKPTEVYTPNRLTWQKGGVFLGPNYEKLVAVWNSTEGDVKAVSDEFGKTKWGETILPKSSVISMVERINKVLKDHSPLFQPPEEDIFDAESMLAELLADDNAHEN